MQAPLVPGVGVVAAHAQPGGRGGPRQAGRRSLRDRGLVEVVELGVRVDRNPGGREAQIGRAARVQDDHGVTRRGAQPQPLVTVDDGDRQSGGDVADPGQVIGPHGVGGAMGLRDRGERRDGAEDREGEGKRDA